MLRKLLGKVESGRFGRGLAGLQAGWQWEVKYRFFVARGVVLRGFVKYEGKIFAISISPKSYSCSCQDYVVRGIRCKHIAFVAMVELAYEAAERSAHRQVQEVRSL
ncbi:SWIM zinc finger family protein [Desulforamulus aquiferis]|uniref:SWIM zinc finger domain-containing protein n=1 Tax=Desulforamulus aquiferis TaxID=1397668 RepID=A0AAW7ZER1_9FIRM|nr:SWIM zinc finger family protein [Desulforamulus aquiferis]MDO7788207.1 SWIM zinc finger domain-containing protein [Desulforamulus aquiferis]